MDWWFWKPKDRILFVKYLDESKLHLYSQWTVNKQTEVLFHDPGGHLHLKLDIILVKKST